MGYKKSDVKEVNMTELKLYFGLQNLTYFLCLHYKSLYDLFDKNMTKFC
jgi:hypothetical protein